MGSISALETAFSTVKRNPVLVAAELGSSIVLLALALVPLVGPFVDILLAPFVIGGMYGMATSERSGVSRLGDYVDSGKKHYASLLGAHLVLIGAGVVVVVLVLIIMVVFSSFVFGISGFASGASGGPELLTGTGLFMLLFGLVFLLGLIVVGLISHFYPVAIVVGGASALGSFRQSYQIVRENVVSVLGYATIMFVLWLLFLVVPFFAIFFLVGLGPAPGMGTTGSLAITAVGPLVGGLLGGVGAAALHTYQAAYYRDRLAATAVTSTAD